jgi:hypothetical protein
MNKKVSQLQDRGLISHDEMRHLKLKDDEGLVLSSKFDAK